VKMQVVRCRDIVRGDMFGLPHVGSSPAASALRGKSAQQLQSMARGIGFSQFQCRGRLHCAMVEAEKPSMLRLQGAERQLQLVLGLQGITQRILGSVSRNESPMVQYRGDHAQVGVLVELQAMGERHS
jgi:hypothetical protein